MTWRAFLNNQATERAIFLPDGKYATYTRYIFVGDRSHPILLTDEKSHLTQSWAVGVNDGTNKPFQLGYEGEGKIEITVNETNGKLTYNASSGFTNVNDLPL